MPNKRKAAIAAGHEQTVAAARTILEEGGNAFDAVVAAMMAACVCEPVLASLGGGGFLLAKPADAKPVAYDFFAHTPQQRPSADNRDFYPILCDFGETQQEFHIGKASCAVPGALKGAFEIVETLGRMPIKRVFEPAMDYARSGVEIDPMQAEIFKLVSAIFLSTPESRTIFGSPRQQGQVLQSGDLYRNVEFADVLEAFTLEGDDLFYRGEISASIDLDAKFGGGTLRRGDLETFEVLKRSPIEQSYKNQKIFLNPPPSSGGLLISFALALLENVDLSNIPFGSRAHLEQLSDIMRLTNQAQIESQLHEVAHEDARAALFAPDLLQRYQREVLDRPKTNRGTTHISVVDEAGNAAALTISNGEGSGYIIPLTGIMLNNMLGEEDINPHGFHNWPTNSRMSSMMTPCLMLNDQGTMSAFGSGGSNRIRTALLQMILNQIDFDHSLENAIQAPRVHVEGDRLDVELGFDEAAAKEVAATFEQAKVWQQKSLFFGGVHAVSHNPGTGDFFAVGDARRNGASCII